MARPRKDETDSDKIDLETAINAESLNPALETLYQELGLTDHDATVHVSRFGEDKNEYNIWRGDPESYDLESLAKKFGSGQYRVKIYVRIPSGHKVKQAEKLIYWQLGPEDEARYKKAMKAIDDIANERPALPQQNNMEDMVKLMMAGFNASIEKIATLIKPAPENPMNTLQGIREIAAMFKPAPQANEMDGLSKMIMAKAVEKLLDDKPSIVNSDGELSPMGVLMRGVEVFGDAIAKKKEAENSVTATQFTPQGGVMMNTPPSPVIETSPMGTGIAAQISQPQVITPEPQMNASPDEINKVILDQSNMACAMAAAGIKPLTFAKSIYELAPDEVIDVLANDSGWFETLCAINPECKKHETWLKECRDLVLKMLDEENPEDPETLTTEPEAPTLGEPINITPGPGHGDTGT